MSKRQSNKQNNAKIKIRGRTTDVIFMNSPGTVPTAFSLYHFVYRSVFASLVAFLLTCSFFMQGVYLVYADESAPDEALVAIPVEPATSEEDQGDAEESVEEVTIDTQAVVEGSEEPTPPDAAITEEAIDSVEDITSPAPEETIEVADDSLVAPDEVLEPTVGDGSVTPVESGDDSSSVSYDQSEEDTLDTSDELSGGLESDVAGGGDGESDEVLGETVPSDASTTTTSSSPDLATSSSELIGPAITTPVGVNYTDSGFMFSKDECTELASGSFYCLEPQENVLEDALFAAPDKDGDLEIFLVRNSIQTQVTDNFVDDAAPFFDQNSDTLVWHRLIDDRYHIMTYDLASGEETQLTRGSQNNMEPIRQGKYTVWQRWVNNNWEIILYDGVKETQVSHASAHDIAPYIHGALVVWNRYGATGEKSIEMYDIASETYVTVDDPEGMSVTNPRMVLVYDQMHPNGDIVTKGYDMIARRFIQLDTLPRELPDEIPGSEPTSETRALIQSKPTTKVDEVIEGEPPTGGEPPVPDLAATTSDPLTLDMSQPLATSSVTVDVIDNSMSEFDLVIPPLEVSEASTTAGAQT